jgi:two-component system OmpR family sensor kinase
MRLVLATTGLVLVAHVIAGSVTYALRRAYLVERVDAQLDLAQGFIEHQLTEGGPGPPTGALVPAGTVAEVVANGRVTSGPEYNYGRAAGPPDVVGKLDAYGSAPFTTGSVGDPSFRYRVLAKPLGDAGTLVVAIPLTDVGETLDRLVRIEGLVALAVLVGLGILSWMTVRRELRPLRRIEDTAGAIAAGDLSRRVEVVDERTEVGRLGRSLNAMLAQIERAFAERTASEARLRRFLADASHELRTPLTSIRGYSELFRRGADARPDDLATSMRRIEEESARMGILVDDLLLLARLDQGRPLGREPVDVARIAADAVEDARAVAPDRSISLDAPPSLTIEGDEPRLREVAANLLSNAVDHTPPGSPVEVQLFQRDGTAVLEVVDHGPGLSQDQRSAVFEPFYRADPSRARERGGAGLGLAIVAAIVAAHGGEVQVGSEPGEGAIFRVTLPVSSPSRPDVDGSIPPPPADVPAST